MKAMKLRPAVFMLGVWVGVGLMLAAAFMAYLDPQLAFTLANKVWSCF